MPERDEPDRTQANRWTAPDDRMDERRLDAETSSEHPPANLGEDAGVTEE